MISNKTVDDDILSCFGYHLIKVTDRRPEIVVPYKHMKESIVQHIMQEKVMNEVGAYLEKSKAEATIERYILVDESEQDEAN